MEEEIKSLKGKLKISIWINALMAMIAFVFFIYAFIQRAEAVRQHELVKVFSIQAHKSAQEALQQKEIAEQSMLMAEKERMLAEEFVQKAAEAHSKKK